MKKLLKILFSLYMTFLSFNIYAIQNCDYYWQTYSSPIKMKNGHKETFKCGNYAKYNTDGSLNRNYYNAIKELNEFNNYYNDNRQILKSKNPAEYVIDNMKINNIINNNKSNNNDDYKQYLLEKNSIDDKIFINNYLLYTIINKNKN